MHAGLLALRSLLKVYELRGAALATRPPHLVDNDSEQAEAPPERRCPPDWHWLATRPRAALNLIVSATFPRVLHIFALLEARVDAAQRAGVAGPEVEDAFWMQVAACKAYLSATQYELPTEIYLSPDANFSRWMTLFLSALRRPILTPPTGSLPWTELNFRHHAQWRVKKWVAHIAQWLLQRCSNPARLCIVLRRNFPAKTLEDFTGFFRRQFAPPIASAMLDLLAWDRRYTSPRVANLALRYLEYAVAPSLTYRVIKPRLAELVTGMVFPYLCIADADLALWADEPLEYVRRTYDVMEDFGTPRSAACSLLFVLSRTRRAVVVGPIMEFLVRIFDAYADCRRRLAAGVMDARGQEELTMLARQKEGAFLAIGTIQETLLSNEQNAKYLNAILERHIVSEFSSDVPFLRARTCWLYAHLTASENVSLDVIMAGLAGVRKCLFDKEFPVRVRAAVDIRHFLHKPTAAKQISPMVGDLLTVLFTLLDDIDNTDIVATIDQVVVGYSDQVAPYAARLCDKLVQTFSRAAAAGPGDDEAGYVATQCLQALQSIISSVSTVSVEKKIQLLAEIEKMISEVFEYMFEEDRIEYFEEALDLLSMFVFHSAAERGNHWRAAVQAVASPDPYLLGMPETPEVVSAMKFLKVDQDARGAMQNDIVEGGGLVSPYLWSLFPRAMHAFHEWASDYSFHYLHLLDSYLSKAPRVFMTSREGETSYVQLLIGMVSRLWDDSSLAEEDFAIQGSRVCGLFLQNCRDLEGMPIERELGILTQLAVRRLRSDSKHDAAVAALITSLAHLTYVSPITTITIIDKVLGCTQEVFGLWMDATRGDALEKIYDRKASAIALSTIVGSDWNLLPSLLSQSIPQVVLVIVKLLDSSVPSTKRGNEWNADDPSLLCRSDSLTEPSLSTGNYSAGSDGSMDRAQTESGHTAAGNEDQDKFSAEGGEMDVIHEEGDEDLCHPADVQESDNSVIYTDDPIATEDGESAAFCILRDVDELRYFEDVMRRLPPQASQQLMAALSPDGTKRIRVALHRAAEVRRVYADIGHAK